MSPSLMGRIGRRSNLTLSDMDRQYYVYILTNKWNTVLYVGVTNDLIRRVHEHKTRATKGFAEKYSVDKLVYFEVAENIEAAILREKQLKGGSRKDKIELVRTANNERRDLYDEL